MSKAIISFEKECDEKRVAKNLRKIHSALEDLNSMGYNMYLSPSNLDVCDGPTHIRAVANQDVVVASLHVQHIDGGDW